MSSILTLPTRGLSDTPRSNSVVRRSPRTPSFDATKLTIEDSSRDLLGIDDPEPVKLSTRVIACLQYGLVSTSITLFNRAVFSVYHFNFPSFVTLVQILVSLVYMYALKWGGWVDLGSLSLDTAKRVAPLALFWWLYVVSGVTALRYLNVPMYSVLRRSTTLLVVAGEVYFFGKRPTRQSLVALVLMVGGAAVAGITDLTFSLPGYSWVAVCVVSTAVYLLLIKKLKDVTGLGQTTLLLYDRGLGQNTLLLYNSLLALPLMSTHLLLGTRELRGVAAFPALATPSFLLFLLVSCSQAFLLNLCIFSQAFFFSLCIFKWGHVGADSLSVESRCTLVNSPLATNVTGQMKDILTTALGMVLFGDVRYSALNVGGITLGLLGSVAYSVVSYLESTRAAPQRHLK
ncbi:hypothetical protein N2152v2_011223 [Parachlorella kessleri]